MTWQIFCFYKKNRLNHHGCRAGRCDVYDITHFCEYYNLTKTFPTSSPNTLLVGGGAMGLVIATIAPPLIFRFFDTLTSSDRFFLSWK